MRKPGNENLRKITADDATIARALEDAAIPALVNAVVHLTGDASLLDVPTGNTGPMTGDGPGEVLGDPNLGISPQNQAMIRSRALAALKDYRDRGCPTLPTPSMDAIQRMMNFIIGQRLPAHYIEFLMGELALNGEDVYAQPDLIALPAARKQGFRVVVIGAGMSGLLAAIRLAEAGIDYTIIEKNPDVGGTWLENTYPGCRVDSPNHTYSYSFAPQDWPQHYSQQEVLRRYFDGISRDFGVREQIRFGTEVLAATWREDAHRWSLEVKKPDGSTEVLEANAVIAATGQLNRPKMPDFPGMAEFRGPSFHSARWEHQHDLTGKRVLVVGTGASAFQFVPVIARTAASVQIFQRTAPWVSPSPTYMDDIPEGKHWLLNHVPFYGKWFRFLMFWRSAEGLLASVRADAAWNDRERSIGQANEVLRQTLTGYIQGFLGDDPELLRMMTPDYPPGGKRMLVDNGTWLQALRRDNVHVTDDPIAAINATGIVTKGGKQHDGDVIVYATGFQSNRITFPMKIVGRGGIELAQQWEGDNPRAYLGITVPNFPNFFMMYGPNTNIVVNGSIIFFSECEMRYILSCIEHLLANGKAALEPKRDVHDAYNAEIDAGNANMAWGISKANSWYKNARGRVTQNWPFTLVEYWERTRAVRASDYSVV